MNTSGPRRVSASCQDRRVSTAQVTTPRRWRRISRRSRRQVAVKPLPPDSQDRRQDHRSEKQADEAEAFQSTEDADQRPQEWQPGGTPDQGGLDEIVPASITAAPHARTAAAANGLPPAASSVRAAAPNATQAPSGSMAKLAVSAPKRTACGTPATM